VFKEKFGEEIKVNVWNVEVKNYLNLTILFHSVRAGVIQQEILNYYANFVIEKNIIKYNIHVS